MYLISCFLIATRLQLLLWATRHLCPLVPVGAAGIAAGELWAPLGRFSGPAYTWTGGLSDWGTRAARKVCLCEETQPSARGGSSWQRSALSPVECRRLAGLLWCSALPLRFPSCFRHTWPWAGTDLSRVALAPSGAAGARQTEPAGWGRGEG